VGTITRDGAWPPDTVPGHCARHHPESLCGVRMDPERDSGDYRAHGYYFTDENTTSQATYPFFTKISREEKSGQHPSFPKNTGI
jgi:hypothetical protein